MASRPKRMVWLAALLALLCGPMPALAEVVRVVIDRKEVLLGGRAFGPAGAYEKLVGRIFFAFDPTDPANAGIVDLDLAPRNAEGQVEVWTDFVVLQPVDPQLRRGVAWVDLGEGGAGRSLSLFHGATTLDADPDLEAELGDALLLREGLTLIQVGWQTGAPTVPGGLALQVPTAHEVDGSPVTGWVRLDWVVEAPVDRLPLATEGYRAYPVAVPEAPVHVLTVREGRDTPRDTVDADEWEFVMAEDGPDAGRPVAVALDGGFRPGRIYELVYRAQDPRVVGLGLAVVRDVMAYARYDLRSEFPTNRGVAFGAAAGGRFLRQFLREGFNADEGGRRVFDAVWIHGAGAGRGSFNARFAQPGRSPSALADLAHPIDLFPFSHAVQFDPVTGLEEGLLDRLAEGVRPRTFTTHTGYDYWSRGAALTHTSVDGFRDLHPDAAHRAYHLASTAPAPLPTPRDSTQEGPALTGPEVGTTLRALAVAMVAWVVDDAPPPASRLPEVGQGTLVPAQAVAYPARQVIPGAPIPHLVHRPDYGPRFAREGIIDREPPVLGPAFPAQVPQVDGLGNEMGGVRGLSVRVPVATYLPWEVRSAGPFSGEPYPLRGRTIPLPLTDEAGARAGDSRPSLQRLYGSEAGFLARVRASASALVEEGFLLEEDREAAIADARARWLRVTAR